MSIRPSAPHSIGQVLDTSFSIFRLSWPKVWGFALLSSILGAAGDVYQMILGDQASTGIAVLLTLAGVIVGFAFYCAIYLRQDAMSIGAAIGGEVAAGFKVLPRLVLMSLALGLVVAVSAIPLFVLIFSFVQQSVSWVVMIVGCVVLCLPPLIFLIYLSLAPTILLVENRRAVESLKLSHQMVRGNWWRTFAILSVGGIILIVGYSLVIMAVAAAVPVLAGHESAVVALGMTVLVLMLVEIVLTPYFIALVLSLYYDLKLRKEGGDLSARIDNLA